MKKLMGILKFVVPGIFALPAVIGLFEASWFALTGTVVRTWTLDMTIVAGMLLCFAAPVSAAVFQAVGGQCKK